VSETVTCKSCGLPTDALAVFPGGRCLTCHAAIWDKVPVERLPRPDFVAAINPPRRGRRSK
jgi:hypothetical protein